MAIYATPDTLHKAPMQHYSGRLELQRITIPMVIGVKDFERKKPKDIAVDVTLYYSNVPKGCESDKIADAACYHKISEALIAFCADRSFHLLEYVAKELHGQIHGLILQPEVVISVRVEKPYPMGDKRLGAAAFTYIE